MPRIAMLRTFTFDNIGRLPFPASLRCLITCRLVLNLGLECLFTGSLPHGCNLLRG